MKTFLTGLALALSLTATSAARADTPSTQNAPKQTLRSKAHVGDNPCAKAKKAGRACVMDFEDGDSLEGTVASGDGDQVVGSSPAEHPSLIELRMNFIDKILADADNVL